ncbi:MAG: MarR family transcriptional regulator, partial [Gammaproteobacteria bacterium]|nr:MarR family transcriptional regulator [Gammaproteobacteria bacterium]
MLEETNDKLKCINLQMLRTSHWVLKTYDDAYRPFGIRATQLPVLSMIAESGPVTIKLIAAEILSERSVLSRKLQVMEKNGWIRQVLIDSSREKAFELTQQGRELLDRVKPMRWQVQE